MKVEMIVLLIISVIVLYYILQPSQNMKEEKYYFKIDNNNITKEYNDNEYINNLIFPLYDNPSMTGNSVGYYTARHFHKIEGTNNNVTVNNTIITPYGVILGNFDYNTYYDKHYLDTTKQKIVNVNLDMESNNYRSAKPTITLLSDTNRMLTINK